MTPDWGMGSISHQELESVESSGRRVQLADGQRGSKSKKEPRPEAEEMGSPAVDATQSLSLLMACVLRLCPLPAPLPRVLWEATGWLCSTWVGTGVRG